jgi:hypothetical protein
MRDRGTSLGVMLVGALAAGACGHPEQRLVDGFFNAVNAEDNLTLSSMSVVPFKGKVDRWSITQAAAEQRSPVPLGDHVARAQQIERAIEANKEEAKKYRDEHPDEWEQVGNLKRDAAVPAKLAAVKARYDEFTQKERDLRKELAASKDALEKEKHNVTLSMTLPISTIEDQHGTLETLKGELVTKDLELSLTIEGQPKAYTMTLRKYDLNTKTGATLPSRWVIFGLAPKG